jgi:hypothetical protein
MCDEQQQQQRRRQEARRKVYSQQQQPSANYLGTVDLSAAKNLGKGEAGTTSFKY